MTVEQLIKVLEELNEPEATVLFSCVLDKYEVDRVDKDQEGNVVLHW